MTIPSLSRSTQILLGIGLLYASLLLSDRNLYPQLSLMGVFTLSTLRLLLLLAPVALGMAVTRCWRGSNIFVRTLLILSWLILLPYTVYSVTEIRHVAELCRLPGTSVYTGACVDQTWTLYPLFVYAGAGIILFVHSLSNVTRYISPTLSRRYLLILSLCLYTSLASVFGLYTRLNMWEAARQPSQAAYSMMRLLINPEFQFNALLFFCFTLTTFFSLDIMRSAGASTDNT